LGSVLLGFVLAALGSAPGVAAPDEPAYVQSVQSGGTNEDKNVPPPIFQPPIIKPLTSADLPPPSVFARRATSGISALPAPERNPHADIGPYREIVDREALAYGVPPELVDAVMAVESGYNPATVGAAGEVGLMQLMPATAAMLGFNGSLAELAVPETNIHYGVAYLAGAWQLAGRDICTATMKYRAGHGETRFSVRSVAYCIRVRAHLTVRGFAVSGTVPTPTFGQPFAVSSRGASRIEQGIGKLDLDSLNTRLRELTNRAAVGALR
jgi:hypothetical protein